jgi:hypothetical protein
MEQQENKNKNFTIDLELTNTQQRPSAMQSRQV